MRPTRVLGFVLVAVVLGVWELAARTGLLDARFVPAPSTIAVAWVGFATSGQLWGDLLATLESWAQGYLIAAVLGVALGVAMGLLPVVRAMLSTTVELLRPMPSVAIIPIAIVLFGLGDPMKRFVVAYAALWPVLINTLYGVLAVDPVLLDTARTFRLGPLRSTLRVVLPAASPYIAAGLRISTSIALILVITAELVASRNGLGYFVRASEQASKVPEVYAGVLTIAVLGYLLNALFVALEGRALAWHRGLMRTEAV
ncbi:MAG TPA: ABC transporter permease [Chloroflexota bacterium]|jgi:ABC-type nitrate/sulfonate/bicarbonate transport system permease component